MPVSHMDQTHYDHETQDIIVGRHCCPSFGSAVLLRIKFCCPLLTRRLTTYWQASLVQDAGNIAAIWFTKMTSQSRSRLAYAN